VVRTGFGIYPNQAAYSIVTNLAQNLPFFVTKTVNSAAAASGVTSKPTIEGHFKTDQWAPPWTRICFTAPAMVAATLVLI